MAISRETALQLQQYADLIDLYRHRGGIVRHRDLKGMFTTAAACCGESIDLPISAPQAFSLAQVLHRLSVIAMQTGR